MLTPLKLHGVSPLTVQELHLTGDTEDMDKGAALTPQASVVSIIWKSAPTTRTRRASLDVVQRLEQMGYDKEQARAAVALAKPSTPEPSADPLCLASGRLLLTCLDPEGRKAGGAGLTQLAIVGETGRTATLALSGKVVDVSYDGICQAVSWAPEQQEQEAQQQDATRLLQEVDVLRGASDCLRELSDRREALGSRDKKSALLESNQACLAYLPTLALLLDTVTVIDIGNLKSRITSIERTDEALDAFDEAAMALTAVRAEALACDALRAQGQPTAQQYGPGQWLTVMVDSDAGRWVDAQVVDGAPPASDTGDATQPSSPELGQHHLLLGDGVGPWERASLTLHPWNHAPRELRLAAFEDTHRWYLQMMRGQHASIVDALSGRRLDVLEQLVPIDVTATASAHGPHQSFGTIHDVGDLSAALHKARRGLDCRTECKACFLLTAGPAAGKSSMMSQLVVKAMAPEVGGALVPILVRVQQLQKRLLEDGDAFAASWNWVDSFLRLKHGEASSLYRMLRQAMMSRRALLLLDGIDEGGKARERIERHITEVLAPQGHVLLVTSRPAGIDGSRYAHFHRLSLSGLSDVQQQQALEQRLGAEQAETLLPYLREHMPVDGDGQRVTSNPVCARVIPVLVHRPLF